MTSLADAAAAVRAARRRLAWASWADGAARGALAGAAAGALAWGAALVAGAGPPVWPLLLPAAGALVGALISARRGVRDDVAALALDRAARTGEAFVTAIAATDASPEIRGLVAESAVRRCPRRDVARFLPLRAPAAATASAIACALLAALVLVAREPGPQRDDPAGSPDAIHVARPAGEGRSAGGPASPRERVEALRAAAASGAQRDESLASDVRADLAAVTDDDLRRLAEALLADPSAADAARRAIDALARGDRGEAGEALREALGGGAAPPSDEGPGGGTAAARAKESRAAWRGAAWPLRYDPLVRRWAEQGAGAEAIPK